MKKYFSLAVVFILLYATLLTAIPTSAATAGPYNYGNGCIKSINVSTTKQLDSGKATYYKATVNSSLHGLNKTYHNLTTHLAIGSKDTKFFVYSGETSDKMGYAKKSVDDLVKAFEAENPSYKVVAAVNGDFFNTNSGEPEEPMMQNGQMLKAYLLPDDERRGGGMVGVNYTTGKVVYHTIGPAYKSAGYGTTYEFNGSYQVQILGSKKTNAVASYEAALSNAPSLNKLSFTTSDFGKGAYDGKTVYEVELERYRKDTGGKNNTSHTSSYFFLQGKVTKIIKGTADMKPAKGKAYIAAISENQVPLLKVGTYVRCQKVLKGDWEGVTNAIGFKQQILAEGNLMFYNAYSRYHTGDGASESATAKWTEDIYDYPHCWKARTAIGFKADGTPVFMVIPYSQSISVGATYYEMSEQFKALGCTNAFLLDGGGSSTMVIRDGNSFNTVCHAEDGADGEGRAIGNIAIMAVLKEGASAPATDKVIDSGTDNNTDKDGDSAEANKYAISNDIKKVKEHVGSAISKYTLDGAKISEVDTFEITAGQKLGIEGYVGFTSSIKEFGYYFDGNEDSAVWGIKGETATASTKKKAGDKAKSFNIVADTAALTPGAHTVTYVVKYSTKSCELITLNLNVGGGAAAGDGTLDGGSGTGAVSDGGCGGSIAFPAVLATTVAAAGVVGFSQKKKKKDD